MFWLGVLVGVPAGAVGGYYLLQFIFARMITG